MIFKTVSGSYPLGLLIIYKPLTQCLMYNKSAVTMDLTHGER